jgi:hypothetical protein
LNDLREEKRNTLQRHTEADLNDEPAIGARELKDLERLLEVEFLIDGGRRIDLDPVERQSLLLFVQELGLRGTQGEVPVGEHGKQHGQGAFDDEEVTPGGHVALDVEDTKGKQAGESVGDVGSSVEEGQSAGQLATSVEGCEVVDDSWILALALDLKRHR